MLHKLFLTIVLFSVSSLFVTAQVKVKKKENKETSPVILETEKFQSPDLKQELEIKEEEEVSPKTGEPIIGAEIFEEQQPGEPEKKKKENKATGKKED
jgi:hypothetical protein